MKFLVAVPCYNPGSEFPLLIEKIGRASIDFLIIDDGSDSETKKMIASFNLEKVVCHSRNLGKGAAIKSGLNYASKFGYSHLVTIDADGQHDPDDIEKMIQCGTAYPEHIILGDRKMAEFDSSGNPVPKSSRFGRQFSNFWVWIETGQWLADTQTGFRVYPVEKTLSLGLRKNKFDFEIEVLAKAGQKGMSMGTIPVGVYYPEKHLRITHFHKFWDNALLTWVHTQMVTRRILKVFLG